ncbi:hypothetical protein D9M71_141690 [compost metagenome]
MCGEVGVDQRFDVTEALDERCRRIGQHHGRMLVARQHRPRAPASVSLQLQQPLVDHRTDIQRLVEQGVDVDGTVTVAEHLQAVFRVLQLLGDDGVEELAEDRAGDRFPGHIRPVKTNESLAFVQAQQAIEFVLVTGRAELAPHGIAQVLIVLEHLQTFGGRVEKPMTGADHQ